MAGGGSRLRHIHRSLSGGGEFLFLFSKYQESGEVSGGSRNNAHISVIRAIIS